MLRREGSIEVICGCMFCGKTEELLRQIRRAIIAGLTVQGIKHVLDKRYDDGTFISDHNEGKYPAIAVSRSWDILEKRDISAHVIAIDEAQFFDEDIVYVVQDLADNDVRVILAGLDTNFRGEPFGSMPQLLSIATKVQKLTAICTVCGDEAHRTQRLVNGKAAFYEDEVILVGAGESYTARCLKHHSVPRMAISDLPLFETR